MHLPCAKIHTGGCWGRCWSSGCAGWGVRDVAIMLGSNFGSHASGSFPVGNKHGIGSPGATLRLHPEHGLGLVWFRALGGLRLAAERQPERLSRTKTEEKLRRTELVGEPSIWVAEIDGELELLGKRDNWSDPHRCIEKKTIHPCQRHLSGPFSMSIALSPQQIQHMMRVH